LGRAYINFGISAKFFLSLQTSPYVPKQPKDIPPNIIPEHNLFTSKSTICASLSLKGKIKAILKNNQAILTLNQELKDSN